jgi:hypothetical protein
MTGLIDYAGLFPPAKLAMGPSVETYNRARIGEHEWMLGRFICPVSRLHEFEEAAGPLMPGTFATSGYREQADAGEPWRLSVLIDGELEANLDEIDNFNARHEEEEYGRAAIDMLEMKITDANQVDQALDQIPEDIYPFFEFPVSITQEAGDCRGFVAALAGNNAGAKIRTGGVVGNAFPTVGEIAAFLHACAAADVPFKATAGLHHPVRGSQRLTYEKDSASCVMHGFLNVFIAAAAARALRLPASEVQAILSEEDKNNFKFSNEVAGWRSHLLTITDLARVREGFSLSFGSCSFEEPVEDLKKLGLL